MLELLWVLNNAFDSFSSWLKGVEFSSFGLSSEHRTDFGSNHISSKCNPSAVSYKEGW